MARDHARIHLSVWDDDDFTALTSSAQNLYWITTSHQDLSWAGVMPFIPARLQKAKDLTESKVKTLLRDLERARFVLVDRTTGELLVRSYVRHDGLFARANMGKAVATAVRKIHSAELKTAVLTEIARVYRENPNRPGLAGFQAIAAPEFEMVQALSKAAQIQPRQGVA